MHLFGPLLRHLPHSAMYGSFIHSRKLHSAVEEAHALTLDTLQFESRGSQHCYMTGLLPLDNRLHLSEPQLLISIAKEPAPSLHCHAGVE